jgi:hypothetical protein
LLDRHNETRGIDERAGLRLRLRGLRRHGDGDAAQPDRNGHMALHDFTSLAEWSIMTYLG